MAAECRVCLDPRVDDIHRAIDGGRAVKAVSTSFGIPRTTLQRHLLHRASPSTSGPATTAMGAPSPTPDASAGRRACLVCRSAARDTIESALLSGEPSETIARAHAGLDGPSADTVRRHATRCIPELLAAARETRVAELAQEAKTKVRALAERAEAMIESATGPETKATLREQAACLTAAKGVLEPLGKLTGELGPDIELRILELPQWAAIQGATVTVLEDFPDALAAVAATWRALSLGGASPSKRIGGG